MALSCRADRQKLNVVISRLNFSLLSRNEVNLVESETERSPIKLDQLRTMRKLYVFCTYTDLVEFGLFRALNLEIRG